MKRILQLEELALFIAGFIAFDQLNVPVWWFFVLILVPDVGMIGYSINNKTGAFVYNVFHHKGLALGIYGLGLYFHSEIVQIIGIILFSHASMDRVFGYGLKYIKGFKFTHLDNIGK